MKREKDEYTNFRVDLKVSLKINLTMMTLGNTKTKIKVSHTSQIVSREILD